MEKYAVLVSGCKADSGKDEFWNDLICIRQSLLANGFPIQNIFVLYGNGTDWGNHYGNPLFKPGKHSITDFPANRKDLRDVFTGLANGSNGLPQLNPQDMLFIWTFGHGIGLFIRWYLKLNDGYIDNIDFTNLVNNIPYGSRIVCMQQCFSGGFIDDLVKDDKTVVLTACNRFQIANRCDDKPNTENESVGNVTFHHGEFNYHLCSAIANCTVQGAQVNADSNGDGVVTMNEVFDYIKNVDSLWTENTQYGDGTKGIGTKVHL